MASVIRLLTQHDIGGDSVDFQATWSPGFTLRKSLLLMFACWRNLDYSHTQLAHVHLSERGSFLREGALLALARKRGLVTVVTVHGAAFLDFAQKRPRLVIAVLRRADSVTCLDERVLSWIREHVPTVQSKMVPNPVLIPDCFVPADQTEELVIFAGEIGARKGADVLCRAWTVVARARPDARCLMVGPVNGFTPPNIDRLEVRPPVGPDEMEELLGKARAVALPSRAEGAPMLLLEAMSVGRPFVSTAVGGIPELANAGGILVPVDDAVCLADQLTELLAKPTLARTLGERGRRFCIETRSVEVIDERLRETYLEAACERDRRRVAR